MKHKCTNSKCQYEWNSLLEKPKQCPVCKRYIVYDSHLSNSNIISTANSPAAINKGGDTKNKDNEDIDAGKGHNGRNPSKMIGDMVK